MLPLLDISKGKERFVFFLTPLIASHPRLLTKPWISHVNLSIVPSYYISGSNLTLQKFQPQVLRATSPM
jgi:hypothetical protein